MNLQRINTKKVSFEIFLLQIVPPTTVLVLSQRGTFHFQAAAVGNRVFALLSMFWIARELWLWVKQTRVPKFLFVFGLYLLLWTLLGVAHGNTWNNIVTDLFLLVLPLGFALGGRRVVISGYERLKDVFQRYFIYNLLYFVVVTIPGLYILKLPQVLPDVGWLVAGFVALWFAPLKFGSVLGGVVGVGALFLGSGYKNVLLQAASGFLTGIIRPPRDYLGIVYRVFSLLFVTLVLVGFFFIYLHLGRKRNSINPILVSKVRRFTESVVQIIEFPRESWNEPFVYLDLSTGERIYELHQVIDMLKASPVRLLVGQGLGGTVDLGETKDPGVYQSHIDLNHVRVVHLGISWVLLKGGCIGLGFYLGWLVKILYDVILSLRRKGTWWWITLHLALLNYALGTFVVFGLWLRQPFLGFCMGALAGLRQIQHLEPVKSES